MGEIKRAIVREEQDRTKAMEEQKRTTDPRFEKARDLRSQSV
jgi:hypothetical protein